jgi:hypothetical protein
MAPAPTTKATRARRKSDGGDALVQQLNDMVAELINENRKLKRQVDKLTARGSAAASSAVERSLRTIQRRVKKALAAPVKSRRRKAGAAKPPSRKVPTKRRRKAT